MLPFISKRSKIRLKVLAWYQIIGGIMGILVTIWIVAHTDQISGLIFFLILFMLGLFGLSIYCGRLLLGDKYLLGFKLSIINQALQIFSFKMLGYGFIYVSGVMLLVSIAFSYGFDIGINFSLTSTWNIDISTEEKPFVLAINFVAIYWIYFINRLQTAIQDEIALSAEDSQELNTLIAEDPTTDPA